jgi:hypothetical protein
MLKRNGDLIDALFDVQVTEVCAAKRQGTEQDFLYSILIISASRDNDGHCFALNLFELGTR